MEWSHFVQEIVEWITFSFIAFIGIGVGTHYYVFLALNGLSSILEGKFSPFT